MYIASRGSEVQGQHGTTRLHMDAADAVNIMVYASSVSPDFGAAMWNIYRAEDADVIRSFLRKVFGLNENDDPIHSQDYFLDISLRRRLFEEYGVTSWTIYQRPGDAVYVPAGCGHQVSLFA